MEVGATGVRGHGGAGSPAAGMATWPVSEIGAQIRPRAQELYVTDEEEI